MKDLTENQARSRMNHLHQEIERHNRKYHQEDNPEISDAEYDLLTKELRDLKEAFPELAESFRPKVGYTPSKLFKQVKHTKPMFSLDNIFTEENFRE